MKRPRVNRTLGHLIKTSTGDLSQGQPDFPDFDPAWDVLPGTLKSTTTKGFSPYLSHVPSKKLISCLLVFFGYLGPDAQLSKMPGTHGTFPPN